REPTRARSSPRIASRTSAGWPKLALYRSVASTVCSRAWTSSSVRSLYMAPESMSRRCSSRFTTPSCQGAHGVDRVGLGGGLVLAVAQDAGEAQRHPRRVAGRGLDAVE